MGFCKRETNEKGERETLRDGADVAALTVPVVCQQQCVEGEFKGPAVESRPHHSRAGELSLHVDTAHRGQQVQMEGEWLQWYVGRSSHLLFTCRTRLPSRSSN